MLIATALVLVGFFLLIWSADLLVDNASELASRLGISTFLVGIIVIGFGTSAPEMAVSAIAALENRGNLALGNALGSNITNIGLVLGSAALIRSLPVAKSTARIDIPIVILTGVIAVGFVIDGVLSHLDGYILLILLIIYLTWSAKTSATETPQPGTPTIEPHELDLIKISHPQGKSILSASLLTVISIILLVAASQMLVIGSVDIAQFFGVSELIIGLTMVAIGTSLPELAASIAAARKGVHDMIIGNIIGSNIFNTLAVLGITGAIQTTEVDTGALWRDFPVMFGFTLFMCVIALTKGSFGRREGGIMLLGYVAYICYLAYSTIK